MYEYMYVFMYICTYVSIYIGKYVCTYRDMNMCTERDNKRCTIDLHYLLTRLQMQRFLLRRIKLSFLHYQPECLADSVLTVQSQRDQSMNDCHIYFVH